MDANGLMYYLKGHFELSNEPPSREAWGVMRAHVLGASPVEPLLMNPIPGAPPKAPCGCSSKK